MKGVLGGGVKSGTVNGEAEFLTASPNCFINNVPVVRANDLMISNCRNTNVAPLKQASQTLDTQNGVEVEGIVAASNTQWRIDIEVRSEPRM